MQHPNHQPASGDGVPSFPPPPPPSHPPLPPGWEQAIDPASCLPYYANRSTGETSWAPPPCFPPPPPPPMLMPPQQLQQQNQHFHHEQPQIMYGSAQPGVPAQQLAPQVAYDIPGNNMSMPSNYSQQYPPNQPQVETRPSNPQPLPANPHVAIPQQQESQTMMTHISSSGLGPSTATSPGLLVPSVRAMIDAEYTHKVTSGASVVPTLELEGLTAGAIADLCNVSREMKSRNVDGGDFAAVSEMGNYQKRGEGAQDDEVGHYYLPLRPFSLPVSSLPPHIEPGRVDIRLHALHSKLGKI
mmetsp:Transcript_34087/g.61224  ORF Transcript_34087/g.61224 Transcript_34087/m.61224 type:complete len:299 (+) Transcript_34087:64-960(+)